MESKEIKKKLSESPEWLRLLPEDPRPFLVNSQESFTVYRTLIDLLDLEEDHPLVLDAYKDLLQDPLVNWLLDNLSDWEKYIVTAHNKADYLPNQLWLLLDWGIKIEDDKRMKNAIDKILSHQDEETGQFLAYSRVYDRKTKKKYPMWISALCDHHLITSVLILAGLKDHPQVKRGINRVNELLTETAQGIGWRCETWLNFNRRGPGRVNEVCPMIIADILRGYWCLDDSDIPSHLKETGKTLLNCWIKRANEKPYMFGHGKKFRLPRAPFFWYNIGTILDACSHYPSLIRTKPFQELVAVSLLEFQEDGKFIPKTVYRFFKEYSFGQKKEASPWMTFFLSRIYKRAVQEDAEIIKVVKNIDASNLKGSKGGEKYK